MTSSFYLPTNEALTFSGIRRIWYAVLTRSRHERLVAHHLQSRGFDQYLPTVTETHHWSDRKKKVETPLFGGYVFVRLADSNEARVDVLRVPGVVNFVGARPRGTEIPDEQIDAVRRLIDQRLHWEAHPFLKEGQQVRVRGGSLDGIEGIFLRRNGQNSLIISVDAIQKSMLISIQGYDVVALQN